MRNLKKPAIPAQAGIQKPLISLNPSHWTLAFARVTMSFSTHYFDTLFTWKAQLTLNVMKFQSVASLIQVRIYPRTNH